MRRLAAAVIALVALGAAPALAQSGMACVQKGLNARGFDAGAEDGRIGARTRTAAGTFAAFNLDPPPELGNANADLWCERLSMTDQDYALSQGWTPVDEAGLRQLYFGATHYWESVRAAGFDYVAEDGSVTVKRSRGQPVDQKGRLSLVGDRLCFSFPDDRNPNTDCGRLSSMLQKDGAYRTFSANGTFALRVDRFVEGNPEGL
jgi:hypothetical protein